MSIEAMKHALDTAVRLVDDLTKMNKEATRMMERAERQSTHSEDCYKWHHACAIARIEQAQKQEPVVGTKTWFEGDKLITQNLYPSDIYDISQHHVDETAEQEHEPLTDAQDIWVLTSECNAYDQYGEYFEAVFIGKPTSEQIQKHCNVTEQGAVHVLSGGGRVKYEDYWYNLRKEEASYGIKGEV